MDSDNRKVVPGQNVIVEMTERLPHVSFRNHLR